MAIERSSKPNRTRRAVQKRRQGEAHVSLTIAVSATSRAPSIWVSGWINTSKKGTKYLALTLKPKDAAFGASTQTKPDFNDEIGF